MAKVKFTGGPLDGEEREMDVYVSIIPVHWYGVDRDGQPKAFYLNVNAVIVGRELRNEGWTHYVFHLDGRRAP